MKTHQTLLAVSILLAVVGAVGCGKSAPSSVSSPAPPTSQSGTTAGQLAQVGQTVYANRCAKCHGVQGQGITGPVLIGPTNSLDKYGTAQGLLDFIDTSMPLDAPASLSGQDYLNVVSFLLVQNNWISSTAPLNAGNLSSISLK